MILTEYIGLLRKFVSGTISATEFESRYLRAFKDERSLTGGPHFDALNDLFNDVDSYCADAALRGDDDIDELQLKISARNALEILRKGEP